MASSLTFPIAYNGALLATCTYAFVRGGRPERIGGLVALGASLSSAAVRMAHLASWAPAAALIVSIDLGVLGAFFWLAVTTIRYWPIWAFAFALANIGISVAGALIPVASLFAYATGLTIYAYLVLAAIAIGTFHLPSDADPRLRRGSRDDGLGR
jgi:hypothetical protein